MKNIFMLIIMLLLALTSCDKSSGIDTSYDLYPVWVNIDTLHYSDTSVLGYNTHIRFYTGYHNSDSLGYDINMHRIDSAMAGSFAIVGELRSLSDWNECNIKFPFDTTKNWLFRFEGGSIPQSLSTLYDWNLYTDTLVLWDSVSDVKYSFTKTKWSW